MKIYTENYFEGTDLVIECDKGCSVTLDSSQVKKIYDFIENNYVLKNKTNDNEYLVTKDQALQEIYNKGYLKGRADELEKWKQYHSISYKKGD